MNEKIRRSPCPIATALDVIGDKWTLVVVRDILGGKKRYGEFLDGPERITTNILAQRLKYLEDEGLVLKFAYCEHPIRYEYELTEKGRALTPVLDALKAWSIEWEMKKDPGRAAGCPIA